MCDFIVPQNCWPGKRNLQLFWNRVSTIDNIFDLIVMEMLVGLEWRELIEIIIKLSPLRMKFADDAVVQVKKDKERHCSS